MKKATHMKISIIIPAKNESQALHKFLPKLIALQPDDEIIVVNDGSTDNTSEICKNLGAKVVDHPYSHGNGGAIKSGARAASNEIIVFMDADGQHKADDIPRLIKELEKGYSMVVGARSNKSHAGKRRFLGNKFYNYFAGLIVGHKIDDLTSGFRATYKSKFNQFLYLLPNGFSYPTTITMAYFRSGYSIKYLPIESLPRVGKSHLKLFKDGLRFLIIIFKVGTLYSPLKIFLPFSLSLFVIGIGYYLYTFTFFSRFTNMSALLLVSSLLIFLVALVSEQITSLIYKNLD